jgi:hypothetical protein
MNRPAYFSALLIVCGILLFAGTVPTLAQVKTSKTVIDFGSLLVGGVSKTDSFYVKSSVPYNLNAVTTSTTSFTILGDPRGVLFDSIKVRVQFSPIAVGTFVDSVVLSYSGSLTPLKVALSGTGISGIVLTSSRTGGTLATLAMADTFATTTRVDSFTIRNTSASAMTVSAITAKTSLFRVLTSLPFTVNASDSQRVRVSYTGTRVRHDLDTLFIAHNHPASKSSPLRLALSARSVSRLVLGLLSITSTSITRIRSYDNEDTLRVSTANSGIAGGSLEPGVPIDSGKFVVCGIWVPVDTVSVVVDSITFTGPHFRNLTPTPYRQPAGYDRNINFLYRPKDLSPVHRDTLVVWTKDNIPSGNRVTLLVEAGSRRAAYVRNTLKGVSLTFGTVGMGVAIDSAIRIYNYQDIPLKVDSIRLAYKNPKYSITTQTGSFSINRGDSATAIVRFTALDTVSTLLSGNHLDTVLVYSDISPTPLRLPLTARVTSTIVYFPAVTSVGFGTLTIGAVKDSTIKVYNRTKTAYKIDSISVFSGKDYFLLSNTLATPLPAGDSTAIQIRYKPVTVGLARDTVCIWHNFAPLVTNPTKIVLTGTGSTNAMIPPSNYITVDNVRGLSGFAAAAPDSSYVETTTVGFYNTYWGIEYGGSATGSRASPQFTGTANGSSARWTFAVDSSGPYLIYHHAASWSFLGKQAYVHLRKFGVGGIVDSMRYDERSHIAPDNPENGSWIPLMMHCIEGVGRNAASITIGADARTSIFLVADAVRLLRSTQKADLEFGRRPTSFSSIRLPEVFDDITIGEEYVRPYRLFNLGRDTLVITDISFYPTNNLQPLPWSYAKNFSRGSTVRIPPMTVDKAGKETGGYFDLQLAFQPYQEGSTRDSMVITSNDDKEPKTFLIIYGAGVNYSFVMNASEGNTEPHFNAPGPPDVPLLPTYRESPNGKWQNSVLAYAMSSTPDFNVNSRVNVGDASTLPHRAWYEFQLPELFHGRIGTAGQYILEYGGPVGSANAYSNATTKVTQSFGVPADSVSFNSVTTGARALAWLQIGGTAKTFYLAPGGPITVEFRRDAQTDATGGAGLLRTDLLSVRKVPTGALIGVDVPQRSIITFGDVSFRSPGGFDGKANLKTVTLGSIGESQIVVKSIRLRNGQYFRLVNPPSTPLYMRALSGVQPVTVAFTPDRIAPGFVDTLEVLSNSTRDSVLRIPLRGNGIGGMYLVDDDGSTQEVFSTPAFGGLYLNGWDKDNMKVWQLETSNTPDSIGRGRTRRLLPIYFNPGARFEWYPAIPLSPKDSTLVLMNVAASIPRGYAKGSPAARYRVLSSGGNTTRDTVVSQNSAITSGASNLIEINLGNHYFLRGGRDVAGGQAFFGHVQLLNDTAAVSNYYRPGTNIARRDTFGLIADAIILRELDMLRPQITSAYTEVPMHFSLSQNYPNPFNPATTIEFTLARQVPVNLEIYDVLGRRVAVLMQTDALNGGKYSLRWDGRNSFGQIVATGIYFYRLVAGDFVQTRKMVVLK